MVRILIFSVLSLLFTDTFSQTALYWGNPVAVGNASQHSNLRPQIAVSNGIPLVIWGSSIGGRKGWVARWNGSAFDIPVKINPTGSISAYSVEGPNITAKGDTAYLVYGTPTSSNPMAMLRTSFDGGQNWNAPVWVDSLGSDMPTFPNVAVGTGGNPIVLYLRQQSNWGNPRYVIRQSFDAGLSFAAEVNVSGSAPGAEVCDCCSGSIYAAPDRIVSVFRNNDNNLRDMWANISTDGGNTFAVGVDLDSTDWMVAACPSSGPNAYFVGDSIYTVFMSRGGGGESRIYISAANMTTMQPAYNRLVMDNIPASYSQNYPAIAGKGDTLGVAWAQTADGNTDMIFTYSVAGMAGMWSKPRINVSDSVPGLQGYPDIAYENGKFHMVWADNATGNVMYNWATIGPPLATETPIASGFSLFPNPAIQHVTLILDENVPNGLNVELLDASGKVLRSYKSLYSNNLRIERKGLPSGLYFIRTENGHSKKLIFK